MPVTRHAHCIAMYGHTSITYPGVIINCDVYIYTRCFTTCGHYCRRWFPRSL